MKDSAHIQNFADWLRNFLVSGKAKRLFKYSKDDKKIMEILQNTQLLSELNAALAKEIEFLADKTIDKKTFLQRYNDIERTFEAKLAGLTKRDNA